MLPEGWELGVGEGCLPGRKIKMVILLKVIVSECRAPVTTHHLVPGLCEELNKSQVQVCFCIGTQMMPFRNIFFRVMLTSIRELSFNRAIDVIIRIARKSILTFLAFYSMFPSTLSPHIPSVILKIFHILSSARKIGNQAVDNVSAISSWAISQQTITKASAQRIQSNAELRGKLLL